MPAPARARLVPQDAGMSDNLQDGYDVLLAAVTADMTGADDAADILALSAPDPATAHEVSMYYLTATVAAVDLLRHAIEAWARDSGKPADVCLQQVALEVRR
jgi:hypothetical protein